MHQNIFSQLNDEQALAVNSLDGPLLVIAGAGSGKTRVVTLRIANLLERGVPPSQILALTFTNKAATEMKERVEQLSQCAVLICTFHSLGAKILRESIPHLGYQRNFTIYDEEDVERVIRGSVERVGAKPEGKIDIKTLKKLISKAKNESATVYGYSPSRDEDPLFPEIFGHYQQTLKICNAVDYDDLLLLPVRLFQEHPSVLEVYQQRWSHLLIDEYQDTNAMQYSFIQFLVAKHHNICAVGDPDQSIYSWRGANIHNILNFAQDFPGAQIIRLNQNYRSCTNILDAANAVISRNQQRYDKKLWSALGEGEKIKHFRGDTEQDESSYIAERLLHYHQKENLPFSEMVVFYRTNAQSRAFEDQFLHKRIPYVIVGGLSFYQRREVKEILSWLRMVQSGADYISFTRTVNIPKRGIGDATLEKIQIGANVEHCTILAFCDKLLQQLPVQAPVKLTQKQREGLQEYLSIIQRLRDLQTSFSLAELVTAVIDFSRYREYLELDKETMADRIENLNALVNKAAEWEKTADKPSLEAFLEELSLKSNVDDLTAAEDRVSLMTIHNGKGLEFILTFIAGLEETLFPHVNAGENQTALEEERRLFYVGMTRARQYLYLTEASSRYLWGVNRTQRSSRFLKEVPPEYLVKESKTRASPIRTGDWISPNVQFTPRAPSIETFMEGDLVYHPQFGLGKVRGISQGPSGQIYKILFEQGDAEKTIAAKYAQLTKW